MSEITVPVGATEVEYHITTSDAGPFTIPFPFFEQSDIKVFKRDDLTGVQAELLNPGDWTFTTLEVPVGQEGVGYQSGAITLGVALTDHTLRIVRNTTIHRITNFPSQGPFLMWLLNNELTRQIAIDQELEGQKEKYLSLPDEAFDDDPYLASGRAICDVGESESPACVATNRQVDASGPNYVGHSDLELAVGAYDNWQNIFIANGLTIEGQITRNPDGTIATKIFDLITHFNCLLQNRNAQEAAFRVRYRYTVECYAEVAYESNASYLVEIPGNSALPFHFMHVEQDIDYLNGNGTLIVSVDIRPIGANSNDLYCQWPMGTVTTSEPR